MSQNNLQFKFIRIVHYIIRYYFSHNNLLILWDFDGTLANSEKKFYLTLKQFIQDKIPNIITNIDEFTEEFYYKNCAGKKYYEDFKILGDKGIIDYSKITEKDLNNFLDYLSIELQNVKDGEITFTKGMDNLLKLLQMQENQILY